MLLQFPLLIVMYDVIRGLTNTVKTSHGIVASPKYIIHSSLLYKHLVLDHGVMKFLGLNLTLSALHLHLGFFNSLPYYLLVIASVGLQYLQIKQITGKIPLLLQLIRWRRKHSRSRLWSLGLSTLTFLLVSLFTSWSLASSELFNRS